MATLHGTCVAIDDRGVFLRGNPGSGKSDLALRLIQLGAILIADDQVNLSCDNRQLLASAPPNLAGLLEVRGVGICPYQYQKDCVLILIVDLEPGCQVERLPSIDDLQVELLGIKIAAFKLDPFQDSAPAKIRAMLTMINDIKL